MIETRNAQFVLRCVNYFSKPAERHKYLELYAPSIILHGYGLSPGIEAVRAYYEVLWSGFPDVSLRTDDIFEAGDKVVSRFTVLGTHAGVFRGIPPTGRHIEYAGITIFRFADGRCVERWSQTDRLALMQQLGQA